MSYRIDLIAEFGLSDVLERVAALRMVEPVGYVEFMSRLFTSAVAITDSGGSQEEATYLERRLAHWGRRPAMRDPAACCTSA
jgi:UDP-N-acetylglucosamine 2-epimerase